MQQNKHTPSHLHRSRNAESQMWLTYSRISIKEETKGAKTDKMRYSARSQEKQCWGATHALLCLKVSDARKGVESHAEAWARAERMSANRRGLQTHGKGGGDGHNFPVTVVGKIQPNSQKILNLM